MEKNNSFPLCLTCRNLAVNKKRWNEDSNIKYYCSVKIPHYNLDELKDIKSCNLYSKINDRVRRVFVAGASGLVGSNIYKVFNYYRCFDVFGSYFDNKEHKDLVYYDFLSPFSIKDCLDRYEPDIFIWCVDVSDLKEKERLYNNLKNYINDNKIRCKFVLLSSSKVFDGVKGNYTEEDIVDEDYLEKHGRKYNYIYKLEKHIKVLKNNLIIRTGNIYGENAFNGYKDWDVNYFLGEIEHYSIKTYPDNIYRNYVHSNYLAEQILTLVDKKACGIYNVINSGSTSPYRFYSMIAEINGMDVSLVQKKDHSEEELKKYNIRKDLTLNNNKLKDIKKDYFKYF